MTDFGKKITFKYKRVIDAENRKVSEFPAIILVLSKGDIPLETTAIVDSGPDTCFISEEIARLLKLEMGAEEVADVLGGGSIKIKAAKVNLTLKKGSNRIPLGLIRIAVGLGIKNIEEGLDVIVGRNPIFDRFKITFEQYKKQVTFERIDPKWRPY